MLIFAFVEIVALVVIVTEGMLGIGELNVICFEIADSAGIDPVLAVPLLNLLYNDLSPPRGTIQQKGVILP